MAAVARLILQDFRSYEALDLTVGGQIVALVGENGAGKTTIFNSISGLVTPASGTIAINGETIPWPASHQLVDYKISRTLQGVGLFAGLSVLENVMMGADVLNTSNFLMDGAGTR